MEPRNYGTREMLLFFYCVAPQKTQMNFFGDARWQILNYSHSSGSSELHTEAEDVYHRYNISIGRYMYVGFMQGVLST